MSRRQFLGTATAATALALGSQLWIPELVRAAKPAGALPNPIPGGTQIDGLGFFHFYFPTANNPVGATDTIENGRGDPATITDFDGMIGMSDFTGGTGVGTPGGSFWSADVRFMKGEYVGVDGKHHHGAFAFI